jgi:hypothetical protein
MKIVEKIKKLKQSYFDDLDQGDCFYHCGEYYIKTDEDNAIKLRDGEIMDGLTAEHVTPVEAEVHILDKKL